jgi:O-antigen/teichoic acid export membrane protein
MYDTRPYSPSGLSIAAFVLGILSIVSCGPCFGLPALVIGLIELQNIKKQISSVEGRAFALTGAILGGISLTLSFLFVFAYIVIVVIAIMAETS